MKPLFAGLRSALVGARSALSHADVRRAYVRLVTVIAGFTVVLQSLGVWGLWTFTAHDDGTDVGAGMWAVRVVGALVCLFVAPFAALVLTNVVFPLFGDAIFMASLRARNPHYADQLMRTPSLPVHAAAMASVRRLLLVGAAWLGLFALALVPGVNVMVPPVQLAFTAYMLGWELLDPFFGQTGVPYRQQRDVLRGHRVGLIGFGLPWALVMSVPVLGPLCFGVAQAAAAQWVCDAWGGAARPTA